MNHFGNPTRRTVASLLLALACLSAVPSGALAQQALPGPLTVKKDVFAEADRQTIEAFVKANISGLSGTADEIRIARTALLKPLSDTPSLNFRLEYASALRVPLEMLVASGGPTTVINALRLAGEAGATGTLPILLAQLDATKEVPPAVRVAAAVGLSRMFEVTAKLESAVNPADLTRAVAAAAEVATQATDPNVADAAIRAMAMAVEIPAEKAGPGLRGDIVDKLAVLASKRAASLNNAESAAFMPAILRAARVLRDVVVVDSGKGQQLPPAIYKNVAAFAGDLSVAIVRLRSVAGIDPTLSAQATGAAGTIVVLSNTLLDKAATPLTTPANVDVLIGPGGLLTKPPFGFPANRFVP